MILVHIEVLACPTLGGVQDAYPLIIVAAQCNDQLGLDTLPSQLLTCARAKDSRQERASPWRPGRVLAQDPIRVPGDELWAYQLRVVGRRRGNEVRLAIGHAEHRCADEVPLSRQVTQ